MRHGTTVFKENKRAKSVAKNIMSLFGKKNVANVGGELVVEDERKVESLSNFSKILEQIEKYELDKDHNVKKAVGLIKFREKMSFNL